MAIMRLFSQNAEGRCVYVTPKDALADIAYADWHGKFTPLGIKVILYPIMMSVFMYFRKDLILIGIAYRFPSYRNCPK